MINCPCHQNERVRQYLGDAGLEWQLVEQQFISQTKICGTADTKKIFSYGGTIYVIGGDFVKRWRVVADCLGYGAIKGIHSKVIRLEDWINCHFNNDLVLAEWIKAIPILWIRLDHLRKHSWNTSSFEEIISIRSVNKGKITFITADEVVFHCLSKIVDLNGGTWKHLV